MYTHFWWYEVLKLEKIIYSSEKNILLIYSPSVTVKDVCLQVSTHGAQEKCMKSKLMTETVRKKNKSNRHFKFCWIFPEFALRGKLNASDRCCREKREAHIEHIFTLTNGADNKSSEADRQRDSDKMLLILTYKTAVKTLSIRNAANIKVFVLFFCSLRQSCLQRFRGMKTLSCSVLFLGTETCV